MVTRLFSFSRSKTCQGSDIWTGTTNGKMGCVALSPQKTRQTERERGLKDPTGGAYNAPRKMTTTQGSLRISRARTKDDGSDHPIVVFFYKKKNRSWVCPRGCVDRGDERVILVHHVEDRTENESKENKTRGRGMGREKKGEKTHNTR